MRNRLLTISALALTSLLTKQMITLNRVVMTALTTHLITNKEIKQCSYVMIVYEHSNFQSNSV
jgi:hypothetical protein